MSSEDDSQHTIGVALLPELDNDGPKALAEIRNRRPVRYSPMNKNAYKPGESILIDIDTPELLDISTAALSFDLNLPSGSEIIANICDIVERIAVKYGNTTLEEINFANVWANVLQYHSHSQDWYLGQGSTLLGITNQIVNNSASTRAAATNAQNYVLPLFHLLGICRQRCLLPLMGRFKLRLEIKLAAARSVISRASVETATYTIDNLSLIVDIVEPQPPIKAHLSNKCDSSAGISIPFTSLTTDSWECQANNVNILRIVNTNSSVLSLFILHQVARDETATTNGKHLLECQSFPLQNFGSFKVAVSGKADNFTHDEVKTYQELMLSTMKCFNTLCKSDGMGIVNNKILTGGLTPAADPVTDPAAYGLCMLSANTSLSIAEDDKIINRGVNSTEAPRFDVIIKASGSNKFAVGDNWLFALVHQRVLCIHDGVIDIQT